MGFEEVYKKYMITTSCCSDHEMAFMWNQAIIACIEELKYKCSVTKEPIKILNTMKVNIPVSYGIEQIPEIKKECENKINGSCQLHNLFCIYPRCESPNE